MARTHCSLQGTVHDFDESPGVKIKQSLEAHGPATAIALTDAHVDELGGGDTEARRSANGGVGQFRLVRQHDEERGCACDAQECGYRLVLSWRSRR